MKVIKMFSNSNHKPRVLFVCFLFLLQLARVSHKNKHLQFSSCLRKDIITSLAGCLALLENELYLTLNYVILGLSQRMFLL